MKILRIVSRLIIGLVFMFSGIVKAIDPLGSTYKFHDYFLAFNLGFLQSLALPLAIMLCTAEFIGGFSVLTGVRYKTGLLGVLVLLSVFTPLTFILALTNPVSDCGCFGDAIHLTNWATFGKNVFLSFLLLILYRRRNETRAALNIKREWALIVLVTSVFIIFSLYNLRYLPVMDFLPYKTGVKIAEKMTVPEGAPVDEYRTTFTYEKNGVRKDFDLNNYPANDTTWKFVTQKSVLLKKGYKPPIHDFIITAPDGEDITGSILSYPGCSVLMITNKLAEAGNKALSSGFGLGEYCRENSINFYILTSSGKDEIKSYNNGLNFCSVDETTLKTIVRANPGYVLIRDGTIIGKWSWANVPDEVWFSSNCRK